MNELSRKVQILNMLASEPHDVFLNYALAMEFVSATELKEADEQLKKVLSIKPDYLPCFYQLGQLNEKLGNNDTALSYYKQGVELAKLQNNHKALGELNEAIWMLED
jgi:Tfp pilus assembly protein PilF